ncbi:MAG: hypothetical protein II369_02080 [Clostridia bacterium]|nr:hypothetical protein [Clostridia bacterium]
MKKEQLHSKTAYLFDELGRVEDRFLDEVLTYTPSRHRLPFPWKAVGLVAAVAASLVLLVQGALLPFLKRVSDPMMPGQDPSDTPSAVTWSLDALLDTSTEVKFETLSSKEEYVFFGDAHLVWQSAESDTLFVSRPLTNVEAERLTESLATRPAEGVSANAEQPAWRIWLVMADGRVITPYLQLSSGNVGYASLFDYHAEVVPNADWVSFISNLMD